MLQTAIESLAAELIKGVVVSRVILQLAKVNNGTIVIAQADLNRSDVITHAAQDMAGALPRPAFTH